METFWFFRLRFRWAYDSTYVSDFRFSLGHKYLLLTEFEGRTVSYGPSFFLLDLYKSKGKKRGSVTYSTDRENEVSKIFITSLVCVSGAQERFLFTRNDFKFLTHLESKTSQFEIVFKSLARFNT